MPEHEELIVHKRGAVCTLTINNPAKRNALTPSCLSDLTEAFERLREDETVKVVILRGAGREAFSAGADINALPARNSSAPGASGLRHSDISTASAAIRNYPYPVIAMLYGYTLGAGCILAMACDIRVASDRVEMGIPTSRMGLIPTYEGFKRFLIVLGYSTALELFLTGRRYDSETCLAKGMINHRVADDALETFTYDLAEEITRCAPLSVSGAKHILTRMAENPIPSPEQLSHFRTLWDQARNSDDHEEAKLAFKEKRNPVFKGR